MKQNRILRTLAIAILLSLLMVTIPASSVSAGSITINPEKGPPGTDVTVTGTSFTSGSLIDVRFDGLSKGFVQLSGTDTSFAKTFAIPTKDPGQYFIQVYDWSGEVAVLVATAVFTITGNAEITIDPDKGTVGSEIEISGEGFEDKETIEVFWDDEDNELDIEDGDEKTDSDGDFFDTIVLVPEATAGDHTIIVKGKSSDSEAEAEFTVEPSITVDPESGSAGISATVSGTGFDRRSDIIITFNGDEVAISGDDRTDSYGSFAATFTVPETAPGSHDIEVEDEDNNDASATFTIAGKISINPVKGNIGTTITVTGSGFKASSPVVIKFDNVQVTTVNTDITGAFSASFPAVKSAKGNHTITATDGTNTNNATFEILTSASIDKPTGNVGTEITFTGSGFNGQVTIKYDDEEIATTTADTAGAFSVSFPIPKSTGGTHTITATDGTNTLSQTFTMESEVPAAPELLLPEAGGKAKTTPIIDWEDVDDPSQPVTYTLQIASDDKFTEDSIVFEKTELSDSEYTITKEEKLESAKKEAPYYWRVKAIDGASNESEWSEPQSFYTGGFSFSMTGWVLYLTISLGALILFIFGLWVGRRTAYY